MKKIKIDNKRDLIIIERVLHGSTILPGTKFYCGCCGGLLCVNNKTLVFPLKSDQFDNSLDIKNYEKAIMGGIKHKECNHVMFMGKGNYGFMALDSYRKGIKDIKKNEQRKDRTNN